VLFVGKLGNMVDTRSKASKQGYRGKQRIVEDLPVGQHNSPALSSGENLVGHPPVPQFITIEQLNEAIRQVQEAVI